jgi:hypothetical protein
VGLTIEAARTIPRKGRTTKSGASARRQKHPVPRPLWCQGGITSGFTAPIVMALGGWKSEAMMRRYAAVTDQTLRAAAEAVSGVSDAGLVRA